MHSLGKKIKALRKRAGLTQRELAKKIGLNSHSTINYIETGRENNPTVKTLDKIANALNTSLEDLLNVKNEYETIIKELKTEHNSDGSEMTDELIDFFNSQEYILMHVTGEELEHLKSMKFYGKKPTKQFYIDQLFNYRNLENK